MTLEKDLAAAARRRRNYCRPTLVRQQPLALVTAIDSKISGVSDSSFN